MMNMASSVVVVVEVKVEVREGFQPDTGFKRVVPPLPTYFGYLYFRDLSGLLFPLTSCS